MNGIYLIDKPADMTSFGVVARIRRLTGEKCGHSGTLDPMATGLLPVMAGKATKLCTFLTEGEKEYVGTVQFGLATDTGDRTGKVIRQVPAAVEESALRALLPRFTGTVRQRTPVYSAVKIEGVPLYKHARAGHAVETPERTVRIDELELLSFDPALQKADLRIRCSKGTYIRTLFEDLAAAAGTAGTMAALRRTRVGRFSLCDARPLDEVMRLLEEGRDPALSMNEVLGDLPAYRPPEFFAGLLENGCAVALKKLKEVPEGVCRVMAGERLIGLGERTEQDGEACLKVVTHL